VIVDLLRDHVLECNDCGARGLLKPCWACDSVDQREVLNLPESARYEKGDR
jgi:hypothetical protein